MIDKNLTKIVNEYARLVSSEGMASEEAVEYYNKYKSNNDFVRLSQLIGNMNNKRYHWPDEYDGPPLDRRPVKREEVTEQ